MCEMGGFRTVATTQTSHWSLPGLVSAHCSFYFPQFSSEGGMDPPPPSRNRYRCEIPVMS